MNILFIDIETRPSLAYVWGLHDEDISIGQLVEPVEVISFAAKWADSKDMFFYSVHQDTGREAMVQAAHDLLDTADVVVHYNGKNFDVPHLNREFLLAGMQPPAPFLQVDLYKAVRSVFRFPSFKLDYVSQALGLGAKVKHSGFDLWKKCMAGDDDAWREMEVYNKRDVVLLEKLYKVLLPWIPNHPSYGAFTGEPCCPSCESENLQRRGYTYTAVSAYQRFRCMDCGKWSRSVKRDFGTTMRSVAG